MTKSFQDKATEALFRDQVVARFQAIERPARRKLLYLHRARILHDFRVPPGNHLEALRGDRQGQYSIRINERWRICFRWEDGSAFDVQIVDYQLSLVKTGFRNVPSRQDTGSRAAGR